MFIIKSVGGDYNSLGIPKVPSNKSKNPPVRPGPPTRPPLPKSPKHIPKAGVISVVPHSMPPSSNDSHSPITLSPQRTLPIPPAPSQTNEYASVQSASSPTQSSPTAAQPKTIPPPLPPIQSVSLKDTDSSNAIYEEINDDVVCLSNLIILI